MLERRANGIPISAELLRILNDLAASLGTEPLKMSLDSLANKKPSCAAMKLESAILEACHLTRYGRASLPAAPS